MHASFQVLTAFLPLAQGCSAAQVASLVDNAGSIQAAQAPVHLEVLLRTLATQPDLRLGGVVVQRRGEGLTVEVRA